MWELGERTEEKGNKEHLLNEIFMKRWSGLDMSSLGWESGAKRGENNGGSLTRN